MGRGNLPRRSSKTPRGERGKKAEREMSWAGDGGAAGWELLSGWWVFQKKRLQETPRGHCLVSVNTPSLLKPAASVLQTRPLVPP